MEEILKENKEDADDLKIQLFKNFRSRREVLDFSNMIFASIMTEELGELNYTTEEYLNLGANYEDTNQDLRAEIDILNGGKNLISEHKPKLKIATYHKNRDIFEIPILLNKLNKNYKIYMCHHPYIPAWDTDFYCV